MGALSSCQAAIGFMVKDGGTAYGIVATGLIFIPMLAGCTSGQPGGFFPTKQGWAQLSNQYAQVSGGGTNAAPGGQTAPLPNGNSPPVRMDANPPPMRELPVMAEAPPAPAAPVLTCTDDHGKKYYSGDVVCHPDWNKLPLVCYPEPNDRIAVNVDSMLGGWTSNPDVWHHCYPD